MRKYLKFFVLSGIFVLISFLLFWPGLSSYFFQDDWFSFSISRARTLGDILNFFRPRADVIYYRPLGMQVPFYLVDTFFGITPIPFKIVTVVIHILNTWLVYILFQRLLKNSFYSFVGALLYVTSASHHILFYWAATFSFLLGQTWYLMSLIAFVKNQKRKCFLFFLLGLLTNEIVLTIPLVLLLWNFLEKQKNKILNLWHFGFVSFLYISIRLINGFPKTENYSLIQEWKQPLLTLRNFVFWALNWPEEVQGQFTHFIFLNKSFIEQFQKFLWSHLLLLAIVSLSFVAVVLIVSSKRKKLSEIFPRLLFGLGWFFITSLPVLFFAHHAYTYYVPLPLIGLLLIGMQLVVFVSKIKIVKPIFLNYFIFFVIFFWMYSSYQTIQFNKLVHWAPQRAERSQFVASSILQKYPQIPSFSTVIITKDNNRNEAWGGESETKWALGDQDAIRILYNDPTLITYIGSISKYFSDQGIVDGELQNLIEPTLYKIP